MNLTGNITHQSEALPGVSFAVRRLNYIARSERDLSMLEDRARLTAILRRMEAICDGGKIERDDDGRVTNITAGREHEFRPLDNEYAMIHQTRIVPAYIRAGLLSVEGLEIEGAPATVESVLKHAPDALLDEVFAACYAASDLSEAQRKNSLSPGSSDAPEAGLQSNTTADAAKQ